MRTSVKVFWASRTAHRRILAGGQTWATVHREGYAWLSQMCSTCVITVKKMNKIMSVVIRPLPTRGHLTTIPGHICPAGKAHCVAQPHWCAALDTAEGCSSVVLCLQKELKKGSQILLPFLGNLFVLGFQPLAAWLGIWASCNGLGAEGSQCWRKSVVLLQILQPVPTRRAHRLHLSVNFSS